jgi:hypothetical protein
MDIFDIAKQGMQIQEDELKEQQLLMQDEKKPAYKFPVFDAVEAASKKDYGWFDRMGEDQKNFQPFMLNMAMGMVWTRNKNKGFKGNDDLYAQLIRDINLKLNPNVYNTPKGLFWLLTCSTQKHIEYATDKKGNKRITGKLNFDVDWLKKEVSEEKYNQKVIKYIADELLSSTKKIFDMIENGLITHEDMLCIEQDLETIEQKKK